MRFVTMLGVLLAALLLGGPARAADQAAPAAEKRIALVVGIGAYQNAPMLPNPPNDARAVGAALRDLGFEVQEHLDVDYRGLNRALREFGVQAAASDVAVAFFAGHGIQVGGQNYLIPADAKLERARDLLYEAMPLNLFLGELSQAKQLGILILDACRNNPFIRQLAANTDGGRPLPVQAGLARIEDTPTDTLVAMATRADAVAEDGTTDHSPYTTALLRQLKEPGLELSLFFRRVRDAVLQQTNGRQEPFIFGSLGATPFYFNPLPPNRNPEIAASRIIQVTDTASSTGLGITRPTDPDDDRLFAQVAGLPRGGSVMVGERVVLINDYLTLDQLTAATFKPDGSVIGDAGRFEFSVMDGRGGAARGAVPITVVASNRPPEISAAQPVLRAVRQPLGIVPPSDPDGDPLVVTVTAVPDRGRVHDGDAVVQPGDRLSPQTVSRLTYDPGNAAAGPAGRFAVTVEDRRGAKAEVVVAVEVTEPETALSGTTLFDAAASEPVPPQSGAPVTGPLPPTAAAAGPVEADVKADDGERERQQVAATGAPAVVAPDRDGAAGPPRAHGNGNAFQDCPECPVMVRVPVGKFIMGDDKGDSSVRPAHRVTIAKPFALGMYEVTVAEWRACVEAGGCSEMPRMTGVSDASPVHNIHWDDAVAYVAWLSRRTGQRYRLPSEAEWEYAARAGTRGRYWWGEDIGTAQANCEDCGGTYERLMPVTVGTFQANPFGLYDVSGSVAEWVADCWNNDYKNAPADGSVWNKSGCNKRVLRGGSWRNGQDDVTVVARLSYDQNVRYFAHGLRVARDLN